MAVLADRTDFNKAVIFRLRQMAAEKTSLREIVQYVQDELGFSREFIVPVLGYLCQAFGLALREVLPLREWWEGGATETGIERSFAERILSITAGNGLHTPPESGREG